jgi:hypothetical protein
MTPTRGPSEPRPVESRDGVVRRPVKGQLGDLERHLEPDRRHGKRDAGLASPRRLGGGWRAYLGHRIGQPVESRSYSQEA